MDVVPPGPHAETEAPAQTGTDRRGPGRPWWREVPVLALVALLLALLVRLLLVQSFSIPSGSMESTLGIGDRVLVSRLAYRVGDVHRGDVVVFDGQDSFTAAPPEPATALGRVARRVGDALGTAPSEHDFVKRVVGLPGDHVVCCGTDGRLTVNGVPLTEPYVHAGDAPSEQRFDVVVPPGRLWVMGDHRSDSADSRSHLGDPGGGTVPLRRVVGKVVLRYWPLRELGGLPRSDPAAASAGRPGTTTAHSTGAAR